MAKRRTGSKTCTSPALNPQAGLYNAGARQRNELENARQSAAAA
jgi:hypothetical protein